jgi:protein-tyrosine-phosphatase
MSPQSLGARKIPGVQRRQRAEGEDSPLTLKVLRKSNFDVKGLRSKSWEEFARPDSPKLDFVFTVCDDAANEVCPVWPGQPMTAHWGVPDPAAVEGDEPEKYLAFADTMRMLNQRIGIFVNLPISSLSKISLQKRLEDIGNVGRSTEPA